MTHRFVVVFASLILAAAVLFEARDLGVELIPEMSQGEFLVDLEWAAGTPLGQTTESVQMLDKRIRTVQGIDMVFALVGTSGQTGGSASDKKEHTAQLHLKLSGVEYEESVVSQVRSMLSDVPDLEYKFSRPSYFSFRTPIEVEISGYNIGTLKLLADEVMERLRGIEGLTDIRSSAEGGQPEIQIFFDRLRLAELGTTVQRIGELLRNKLQGEVATELARRDRKVDIRVRALDRERETLDDLKRMVVSPANYPVPVVLENVAAVRAVDGPAEIRRIDQERVAVISANIQGRDLGSVVADIESRLADMAMPEGFGLSMGGQDEGDGALFRQYEVRHLSGHLLGLLGNGFSV